jgi:hypothetical protein
MARKLDARQTPTPSEIEPILLEASKVGVRCPTRTATASPRARNASRKPRATSRRRKVQSRHCLPWSPNRVPHPKGESNAHA